jgi:hypothetical protein
MKVIFIDIDGVLNDHTRLSNGYCGIKSECVENMNLILDTVLDLNIVISSAWRYMIPKSMTLTGFEYLLLVCGINCRGRISGHTRHDNDEEDTRGSQISDYLNEHTDIEKYIVVDDMDLNLTSLGDNFLQTNGNVGLTKQDAERIIRHFV